MTCNRFKFQQGYNFVHDMGEFETEENCMRRPCIVGLPESMLVTGRGRGSRTPHCRLERRSCGISQRRMQVSLLAGRQPRGGALNIMRRRLRSPA